jgi:hypothetical protein
MALSNAERQRKFRERQRYLADAELGARLVAREQAARYEHPEVPGVPVDAVLISEEERVANALRYAAWRWDGFQAGEIVSL